VLKAYEVREGLIRKDDNWPERFYDEPMPEGGAKRETIFRKLMAEKLSECYQLRGWDVETGIPTRGKFVELGLGDIADDLGNRENLLEDEGIDFKKGRHDEDSCR